MIPREYYYHYGNSIVSGVPEKKGTKRRRLIGIRSNTNNNNDDNNNESADVGEGTTIIRLQTADNFDSSGNPVNGSRPRMASKWDKNLSFGVTSSIAEREEKRKRAELEREFGENCQALRERPDVHIISYSEHIPGE